MSVKNLVVPAVCILATLFCINSCSKGNKHQSHRHTDYAEPSFCSEPAQTMPSVQKPSIETFPVQEVPAGYQNNSAEPYIETTEIIYRRTIRETTIRYTDGSREYQ